MAKKKKAAKKGSRKTAPKKKAAAKKPRAKGQTKTLKPPRQASAKGRTSKLLASKITDPEQPSSSVPAPPMVEVWPKSDDEPSCDLQPHGRVHAKRKSDHGQVNFFNHGTRQCTIHFDNDKVFGTLTAFLALRDNYLDVKADPGENDYAITNVTIDGCDMDGKRILNGPTDIVVP